MKKFLIVCTVVILTAMLGLTLSDYKGLSLRWFSREPVTAFTGVEGKTILLDTGKGMEPFEIRGVNMGVGIPGHFATDYAIDKETYLRPFCRTTFTRRSGSTIRIMRIRSMSSMGCG